MVLLIVLVSEFLCSSFGNLDCTYSSSVDRGESQQFGGILIIAAIMEFIILQPLQTNSKDLNVSLIQRRHELTPDEESSILHEGDGQYEGFVIKKSMPQHMQASLNLAPCHLLCKLKLYMKHATNSETRHVRSQLYLLPTYLPLI